MCVCVQVEERIVIVSIGLFVIVLLVVDCFNLTNPTNGQVSLDMTTFGAVANYSCNEGYILMGPTARICQSNGNWTNDTAVCQSKSSLRVTMAMVVVLTYVLNISVVDCLNLTSPSNGQVSHRTTTFGSVATYTCEDGYMLMGFPMRECLSNGNWSQEEPVCESKSLKCGMFE